MSEPGAGRRLSRWDWLVPERLALVGGAAALAPAGHLEAVAGIGRADLGAPDIGEETIGAAGVHRQQDVFRLEDEIRGLVAVRRLVAKDGAGPAVEAVHGDEAAIGMRAPPAKDGIVAEGEKDEGLPWWHELGRADLAAAVMAIGEGAGVAIELVDDVPDHARDSRIASSSSGSMSSSGVRPSRIRTRRMSSTARGGSPRRAQRLAVTEETPKKRAAAAWERPRRLRAALYWSAFIRLTRPASTALGSPFAPMISSQHG